MTTRLLRGGTVTAALATICALASATQAGAAQRASDTQRPWLSKGTLGTMPTGRSALSHGGLADHLPPAKENMHVVSKLRMSRAYPGAIADVAVHKGFAYLMSWDDPECERGGFYVVDIRTPSQPRELTFVPAKAGYYHGEGAHAVTLDTPQFKGDLLAVNNEAYSADACGQDTTTGGFELWNVTNPANPVALTQDGGDTDGEQGDTSGGPEDPNSYHSVFVWQDGPRAYLVGVDNSELSDIDIYDITDPRAPEKIADVDALDRFDGIYTPGETLNGDAGDIFHHDMVVKRIGGRMVLLADYWDAGYLQLDVTNPANPTLINHSAFTGPDMVGNELQEGNAHQAEFSHDNRYVLAADEDFSPYRPDEFRITDGPNAGLYDATSVSGGAPVAVLPDLELNGPTIYGGYGCDASKPVPQRADFDLDLQPGEEAILVLQRGPTNDPQNPEEACFPGEKAANADEAGWDAVLLTNRHQGSADADGPACGSGGYPQGAVIVTVCTTHEALHRIFGSEPQHGLPVPNTGEPTIGDAGARISATVVFDGWGHARLLDRATMQEVGRYAIPESLDERYASGFGDLSIHEWATDPTENLAYAAYYAGGMRVARFGPGGIEEVGKFIDQDGSNFWGVEQFTDSQGNRLIAGSDRDFGLVILQYTGPGAAVPPSCATSETAVPAGGSVTITLSCTDANGNPLTRRLVDAPDHGSTSLTGDRLTYTPRAGFVGNDGLAFVANDGAADSRPAIATFAVRPAAAIRPQGKPSNRIRLSLRRFSRTRRSAVIAVTTPGPGRLAASLRVGSRTYLGKARRTVRAAGKYSIRIGLDRRARRALARVIRRTGNGQPRGTITVQFTPTGGDRAVTRKNLRLR